MENQTENNDNTKAINRRTFISISVFSALTISALGFWRWLYNSPLEKAGITRGTREPLRKALNASELAFKKLYDPNQHVTTYPVSMAAKKVRQNGNVGLKGLVKIEDWQLNFFNETEKVLSLTLDDIKSLPKTDIVFDFKCVEGWDQISHWGGVKIQDIISHYNLQSYAEMGFMGLKTPDEKYFVGLDMPSAIHPQSLLCYEMNGKPLPMAHGYPLRLIIPVKYGIKNLKRVSSIIFSNERPRDYWAERGYDYYSGL